MRVDPGSDGSYECRPAFCSESLDRETQAFGLAVPSGIVTHTGVAGLTLGGGIGWIMRKHGLSIDQLVSVDSSRPTAEFIQASADRER